MEAYSGENRKGYVGGMGVAIERQAYYKNDEADKKNSGLSWKGKKQKNMEFHNNPTKGIFSFK